ETGAFGLATTGGMISSTGVAGLTLGGGIGWLMRKHGLACDNLLSVDLVTADGRLITADAKEHSDLFWGVRGGGGNFGVVTSFEFRVHPLPSVYGGMILHHLEDARDVLRFYREWAPALPAAMNTFVAFNTAPPAPFIPAELHGRRMLALAVVYAGDAAEGEALARPLLARRKPAFAHLGPLPYVVLQSMFDGAAPAGMQSYWKSAYLPGLPDAAVDTLLQHAATLPQPMSAMHIHQMGGAVRRLGAGETAFVHRDAEYCLNLVASWFDPAENEANIAWTRTCFDAVQPYSRGVYVNFLGDEGEERVRASYGGDTYARLAALKAAYDPTNFFRMNQNIVPNRAAASA
ncbi:MAG TPA: BBE domain-containing protein, partial [Limnochordia bacterium]|nr:BBE domain-containing protein [Limnochordia bacterium]